MTAGKYNRKKK